MRRLNKFLCRAALAGAAIVSGCAAANSPSQLAIAYRQMFNAALQSIHQLHAQGKLGAAQERVLLPAILAGSTALDRLDADAAAGDQADFDLDLAAARAALQQLQSAALPATAPSTAPAPAGPADAVTRHNAGG